MPKWAYMPLQFFTGFWKRMTYFQAKLWKKKYKKVFVFEMLQMQKLIKNHGKKGQCFFFNESMQLSFWVVMFFKNIFFVKFLFFGHLRVNCVKAAHTVSSAILSVWVFLFQENKSFDKQKKNKKKKWITQAWRLRKYWNPIIHHSQITHYVNIFIFIFFLTNKNQSL